MAGNEVEQGSEYMEKCRVNDPHTSIQIQFIFYNFARKTNTNFRPRILDWSLWHMPKGLSEIFRWQLESNI